MGNLFLLSLFVCLRLRAVSSFIVYRSTPEVIVERPEDECEQVILREVGE